MLVLSRKVGERIHVGDDIVLEIRRIAGNRVTLALSAPRDVRILRGELEAAAKEFCGNEADASSARETAVQDAAMSSSTHVAVMDSFSVPAMNASV